MRHLLILFLLSTSFIACSQTQNQAGYKNLDNKAFAEKLKDTSVVILDVRTPDEYNAGHIPNATLVNFYDADFKTKVQALDKDKTYLVYCAAGGRSSKASTLMTDNGIKAVYNLQGGFNKWDGPKEK